MRLDELRTKNLRGARVADFIQYVEKRIQESKKNIDDPALDFHRDFIKGELYGYTHLSKVLQEIFDIDQNEKAGVE